MKFAENLKNLRGKSTRKDFAERLGIRPNTLRNYEEGLSLPNFELGLTISRIFNVDPFWLLGQESMDNETGPEKAESAGSCKQCESYKEELA
ncbi:hypothetical protein ADUPG1_005316, partial [Aduncisulcus paluster]